MTIYEDFFKKQQELIDATSLVSQKEMELTEIKRLIYKEHKERFKKKPVGKTTIEDGRYQVTYNCTEKTTLLLDEIKRKEFSSPCIVEKITPEKKSLAFDKKKFKKMTDSEQEEIREFVAFERNKPTINVLILEE